MPSAALPQSGTQVTKHRFWQPVSSALAASVYPIRDKTPSDVSRKALFPTMPLSTRLFDFIKQCNREVFVGDPALPVCLIDWLDLCNESRVRCECFQLFLISHGSFLEWILAAYRRIFSMLCRKRSPKPEGSLNVRSSATRCTTFLVPSTRALQ